MHARCLRKDHIFYDYIKITWSYCQCVKLLHHEKLSYSTCSNIYREWLTLFLAILLSFSWIFFFFFRDSCKAQSFSKLFKRCTPIAIVAVQRKIIDCQRTLSPLTFFLLSTFLLIPFTLIIHRSALTSHSARECRRKDSLWRDATRAKFTVNHFNPRFPLANYYVSSMLMN